MTPFWKKILLAVTALWLVAVSCGRPQRQVQYFFLNDYHTIDNYKRISDTFNPQSGKKVLVGRAVLIYLLEMPVEELVTSLKRNFALSEEYDVPLLVEIDPISFWKDVPWLWNWWDESAPGYNPDNRNNVEWFGWGNENAVKIGWINWGVQFRMLPMANLLSPAYQDEVKQRMRVLLKETKRWYRSLPRDKKYLLGGIKLTGEMGLGFNNWYYPDGNSYYDKPESEDPTTGVSIYDVPARGVAQIGYAALSAAGIKSEGEITPEDIYEVESRFCRFMADIAVEFKFPREMLFLHSCGTLGDKMACVQEGTCPSWTFYHDMGLHPEKTNAMDCLKESDAPYWAMAEWNIWDQPEEVWYETLKLCFSLPRLKYVTLFNAPTILLPDGSVNEGAVSAIKRLD